MTQNIGKEADIIIVGAGLAGLVAAAEAVDAGRRIILLDQEPEASLGGQAFWSFGGLFMVGTPEQRLMGIRDSHELALRDWLGSAAFDRPEDHWPRQWARAYVDFAAGEMRSWLQAQGLRFVRVPMWAERGGYLASGHGNSVPRFHITWGTGPGVLEPFIRRVKAAEARGLIRIHYRHKVTELITEKGVVKGVRGNVLEPDTVARGEPSSRKAAGDFSLRAQAVIISSGGIGANFDLVRKYWPAEFGKAPKEMLQGVPDHVDGSMFAVAGAAGAHMINLDRMWHYPEGIQNYAPVWRRHGIRILSGPTPLWLDAHGKRLPGPLFPGFDALGALRHICQSGHDYSWFVLNQKILKREFGLSGSEQNGDLTNKHFLTFLRRSIAMTPEVARFQQRGVDFISAKNLEDLTARMNQLTGGEHLNYADLRREVADRDNQIRCGLGKDGQIMAIVAARRYLGDRLFRISSLDTITNPDSGPLIAVRLRVLTRKTMGGLEANLAGQVLAADGNPIPGLYTAGEVSGFGGGGVHGYRALEGTFLGGCIFSGRTAGRSAAAGVI